jgi:uncharacterized membrane protein
MQHTKVMKLHKVLSKKILQLCLISALLPAPFLVYAAEQIDSFTSDIFLSSGSFIVKEQIVYDFGDEQRHGIFRTIEKTSPQKSTSATKKRYIDLNVLEVTQDGGPAKYTTNIQDDFLEIKIGDPYTTITGVHTYTIEYEVFGGYSFFDDKSAEIYWNVTGTDWEVPIASVVARVHQGGVSFVDSNACYRGTSGAKEPCDSITMLEDGTSEFVSSNLPAGEGLTIAQEINAENVAQIILEKSNHAIFYMVGVPIFIIMLLVWAYRYKSEYKIDGPIIAQYEPYENFKPMYSGVLLDGRLDARDITAGIVYLAEQGFIAIQKIERKVLFVFEVDDYVIELKKPQNEIDSLFLKSVLELLFLPDAEVGSAASLTSLKYDSNRQMENAKKLEELRANIKKDLYASDFFQKNGGWITALIFSSGLGVIAIFFTGPVIGFIPTEMFIAGIVLLVCLFIFSLFLYERRTRKGYEAQNHLKGFKLFLSVTDEERFAFHNAPQKSPEQFMQYLPYAIAFGVEKQWAKVFEGITIPNPDWYDGGSTGATFSAIHLSTSLGAFSTSFTSSASTSGGSGGGGSSGGGGGGGGGGSW